MGHDELEALVSCTSELTLRLARNERTREVKERPHRDMLQQGCVYMEASAFTILLHTAPCSCRLLEFIAAMLSTGRVSYLQVVIDFLGELSCCLQLHAVLRLGASSL